MITATASVFKDGELYDTMYPAKWYFRKHESQPTTEVAIRRGFAQDVYVVLAAFDVQNQTATLDVTVSPLVNWIWAGFGVLALGTLIALLPETAFAFAMQQVPANAVTSSVLLLALVLSPVVLRAQSDAAAAGTTGQVLERTDLQREMEGEIQCTCGGCNSSIKDCPMMGCHGDSLQTAKLQQLIAEGKTREEILAAYVSEFGSQAVLSRPIDRGFNRLAWAFPYMVAVVALVGVFVTARRWSSRSAVDAAAGDAGVDPTLDARLDDELRNLD